MTKVTQIFFCLFLAGSRHAFAFNTKISNQRTFCTKLLVSESESEPGALVPVNQESVEFTAGVLGAAAGFIVGGPVLGAIGGAVLNYASKTGEEVGEVTTAVSTSALQVFNYLSKLDKKYSVLDSAKSSLESALDSAKAKSDSEAIAKVEAALATTNAKIKEINDEYDLVGAAVTALGVVGELVEKAVKKGIELNEEYNLSAKALDVVKSGVDKAKTAAANRA